MVPKLRSPIVTQRVMAGHTGNVSASSGQLKNMSDKECKDLGNKMFSVRNLEGAIEAYSMAILKNGSVPHYFTNR